MTEPSLTRCSCGSKAFIQEYNGYYYGKCKECGQKSTPHKSKDMAVAAWSELNPAGKPTSVLVKYSDFSHWQAKVDSGELVIHAMEFDEKRHGYQLTVRWL